MDYETVESPAFRVTGFAQRVSNDDIAAIGALWQRFMGEPLHTRLNALEESPYAVYYDYAGDYTQPFSLLVGYRVAENAAAPAGLESRNVPAARYARIVRKGPMPETIVGAWQEIWAAQLNRTYRADFERYPSQQEVEVNVGIV